MEVPQSRFLPYFTPQAGTSLIESSTATENNYSPTEEFSNLSLTGATTNGNFSHNNANSWHQIQPVQQYPNHRDGSSTAAAAGTAAPHFSSTAGATSSMSYRSNMSSSHQMFLSPGGSSGGGVSSSRSLNVYQNMAGSSGGGRYPAMYDSSSRMGPSGVASGYLQSSHSQVASANAANFFLSNDIRTDSFNKSIDLNSHVAEYQQTVSAPGAIPPALMPPFEVTHYKYVMPLDSQRSYAGTKSSIFMCVTSCYSAVDSRDGRKCFLRRVHNFRPPTNKCMYYIESWKKVSHPNVVSFREVFTTKAFGDNSTVFVYDYLPSVTTLSQRIEAAAAANPGARGANGSSHKLLFAETLIWNYIIQLTAAMRSVHMCGLACRSMDVTKILIDSHNRLYFSGSCIIDTLTCDNYHVSVKAEIPSCQQDDLKNLAKVTMALASGNELALAPENYKSSYDLIHSFSEDLRHFINYLFMNSQRSKNLNDIMPMIGARFYAQFEASLLRSDQLERELIRETHNSRLLRLLVKLGSINERPDFNLDSSWSETGDRYLLKLFRDYLFHQVTEDGSPWLDMSHVTSCLNKLDCGVDERLMLVSRDSQNALVVTYADLKMCMENTFSELNMSSMAAAAAQAAAQASNTVAANGPIANPPHDPAAAMVMPLLTSSSGVATAQAQSMHMVNGGAGDAMQKYMLHHHAPQPSVMNTAGGPVSVAATDQLAPPSAHHINGGEDTLSVLSSAHVAAPSSATNATTTGTNLASTASSDITNAPLSNGSIVINPLYNGTVD